MAAKPYPLTVVHQQIADSSGEVTLALTYQPFGELLASDGAGQSPYGYTGEWTDNYIKLQYLRSRWYSMGTGRFISKDTWQGDYARPLSLNGWIYVEGNPVNRTEPTGMTPDWCKSMKSKFLYYYYCMLFHYSVRPLFDSERATKGVTGSPGCYSGPIEYRAGGYLEGVGGFVTIWWGGEEIVYDFATMESQKFMYLGPGINDSVIGVGVSAYGGFVSGFQSDQDITTDYSGPFFSISGGGGIDVGQLGQFFGLGGSVTGFVSWNDIRLFGISGYIGGGLSVDMIPGGEIGIGMFLHYLPITDRQSYVMDMPSGEYIVNRSLLLQNINSGYLSPWPFFIEYTGAGQAFRAIGMLEALRHARIYEEILNAK